MATNSYGVNDALAVKLWSGRMDVEALKETQVYAYIGSGSSSLCQQMTETQKGVGDKITWGLRMLATGVGTTENETQEGNEEGLTRYSDAMFINELGHAHRVRREGTIDVQRVPYNLREECYESLKDWAADRFDSWFFNQIGGNTVTGLDAKYYGFNTPIAPSSTRRLYAGGQTTDQGVQGTSSAVFTLNLIDKAVATAKTASPMIRPLKGLGKDVDYVCFLHPYQVYSLRADTSTAGNWFDLQGKRLQGGEGDKSNLVTGAVGIYNRTLMVESVRVPYGVHGSTAAAQTSTRRAIFCGAQAASLAFGKGGGPRKFKWSEETFDYDRELGVRASFIGGMKKTVYNSVDYGTIVISTYAAAP